jgi:hypothetical protein
MRPFCNYSVTDTKVVDINFVNERVVVLEGFVQWKKSCQLTSCLAVIMILVWDVDG